MEIYEIILIIFHIIMILCITNIKCDKDNYHSLSFILVKNLGSNIWNGIVSTILIMK